MTSNLRPFHLAFPVRNLKETKKWYTEILGCKVGRKSKDWIDFNMFGHQIVAHLSNLENDIPRNEVDGENIPIRHFGVILEPTEWNNLKKKLLDKGVKFIVKPQIRFKGQSGEQKIMFINDPSGNVLEFKSFRDDRMIFEV